MSKITRKAQKIFGSTSGSNQLSQFGSLAAGSPVFSSDPDVIQGLSNYLAGWNSGVIGGNSPAIEDMNSLCYLFAYQLAYILQAGVPEWNATTVYYKGSLCSSAGIVYISLTDTNTGNAVTSAANWGLFQPFLNVKAFGATGNGSTDDTTSIQAALTAIGAGGGTVYFPPGTYLISTSLVPVSKTEILGAGVNASVLYKTAAFASTAQGMIQGTDLQNIRISKMGFSGGGSWTSTPFANPYSAGNSVGFTNDDYGVRVNVTAGAAGISIENCYFQGLSRAISINPNGSGLYAKNVTIKNNRFENLGFGAIFLYQTNRFVVDGNIINQVYGNITAAADTSTSNSKFGDGIGLNSATDGVVANNVVHDYLRTGIIIEPYGNPIANGTTTNTSPNVTSVSAGVITILAALLAENQTIGVVGTGIPTGATLVSASGTTAVMSANATASATVSIQYIVYSSRVVINANTIDYQHSGRGGQDWTGIYVSDSYSQEPIIISNNSIYNLFGSSTAFSGSVNGDGIVVEGCMVTGNVVWNCGGTGLIDAGSENSFKNNKVYNCNQYGIQVLHQESGNVDISNCEFVTCGFAGATLAQTNNARVKITDCLFVDNGALTNPLGSGHEGLGLAGIAIGGGSVTEFLMIQRCTFISSANTSSTVGQLYGILAQVSSNFNQFFKDNLFIFTDATAQHTPASIGLSPCSYATYFNTGGYTCYDMFPGLFSRGNDNNKYAWSNNVDWVSSASSGYLRILGYASAAPGAGTFRVGDAFLNSSIASGGKFIFVCVVAGTPGTWQSLTLS